MRCLRIFVKCLNFLGIFLNVSQGKYLQEYLKSDFENRAQFVEHLSSFLNKENIAFVHVFDSMACVHQCISHSLCYSVNFVIHPEDQGHRCELLPTDKYRYPYNFEKNASYHHYSIVSPCDDIRCKNGAKCLPLYNWSGYHCKRRGRIIEEAVPWLKVSDERICFGAKDDSYGMFTIPWDGAVISIKLVYISGYVTCQKNRAPFGSHWGCDDLFTLLTYITNNRNEVIFPDRDGAAYTLPDYHANSPELVFRALREPEKVRAGVEFRIWYRQDRLDSSEDNNAGQTCSEVYVLMS